MVRTAAAVTAATAMTGTTQLVTVRTWPAYLLRADRARDRDAEPGGPRRQARQDRLVELDAVADLPAAARQGAFAGQPDRRLARPHRRLPAEIGKVLGFAEK